MAIEDAIQQMAKDIEELNSKVVEEETTESTDETEESTEESKGDDQAVTPTADKKDESEQTEKAEEDKNVPLAALEDERHKRQEIQKELQDIKKMLEKGDATKKESQEPIKTPDIFDNPEEYVKHVQGQINQNNTQLRVEMSEMFARDKYEDYDKVVESFSSAAKENPALVNQMLSNPNPAIFAYKTAKKLELIDKADSIDEMKKILKEQMREEILAEMKEKKGEGKESKAEKLPKSISDAGGSASSSGEAFNPSLEEMLGLKK